MGSFFLFFIVVAVVKNVLSSGQKLQENSMLFIRNGFEMGKKAHFKSIIDKITRFSGGGGVNISLF